MSAPVFLSPLCAAVPPGHERLFHVTVASNFARAFDKYTRLYNKAYIAQSTFADRFFLLRESELGVGYAKAHALLSKLALPGDRLVVLETVVANESLQPNLRTGLGRFIQGTAIHLQGVHWVTPAQTLERTSFEEVYAHSLHCLGEELAPYAALRPRTLSVLPVARACQASCRFCFSESSASLDQAARVVDVALVERWMAPAAAAGAERFVITGGGEPGLLKHDSLVALIEAASRYFDKVVLITNGVHLARRDEETRHAMLADYARAGLSVLALSRHHDDAAVNAGIMGIDTGTERVLKALREGAGTWPNLRARLICVLQQGGIGTDGDIERYLSFAQSHGVTEVCFKELYVSTTLESAYHARPENNWSREHQVGLSTLLSTMHRLSFDKLGELPWGAPFFQGRLPGQQGAPLRVAAYTEPSVYWERAHGLVRSWNLMADGSCLASLEDPASLVHLQGDCPPLPGDTPRRVIRLNPVVA